MLADSADAKDAAQEILIRIITHLSEIRDKRAAGAWAMRIAMRHLVKERRRSRIEAQRFTFITFAADLADGLTGPVDIEALPPDRAALANEVKISCTLAL